MNIVKRQIKIDDVCISSKFHTLKYTQIHLYIKNRPGCPRPALKSHEVWSCWPCSTSPSTDRPWSSGNPPVWQTLELQWQLPQIVSRSQTATGKPSKADARCPLRIHSCSLWNFGQQVNNPNVYFQHPPNWIRKGLAHSVFGLNTTGAKEKHLHEQIGVKARWLTIFDVLGSEYCRGSVPGSTKISGGSIPT